MPTAMPTLVLLAALLSWSATVALPSALACELVAEVEITARLPEDCTEPAVSR